MKFYIYFLCLHFCAYVYSLNEQCCWCCCCCWWRQAFSWSSVSNDLTYFLTSISTANSVKVVIMLIYLLSIESHHFCQLLLCFDMLWLCWLETNSKWSRLNVWWNLWNVVTCLVACFMRAAVCVWGGGVLQWLYTSPGNQTSICVALYSPREPDWNVGWHHFHPGNKTG